MIEAVERRNEVLPISVIVCTRDRPADLARCLNALAAVDYPDFEVVIVDNGSAAGSVSAEVERFGFRSVRCDTPGLSRARNAGVSAASHDILAFTDDDAVPARDWLRRIADVISDPTISCATGGVRPIETETEAQRLFEVYGNGMWRGAERRRFDGPAMSARDRIATQFIGVGANMAFRRAALQDIGGFDVALGAGTETLGGEDLDAFHRILAGGGSIVYEPSMLVHHRHRREMHELRDLLYANGRAFGCYLIGVFRRRSVPRPAVLGYALFIWLPWLASRWLRGLVGLHRLPVSLLWAELRGAVSCLRYAPRGDA